jgi:hypothetical protein
MWLVLCAVEVCLKACSVVCEADVQSATKAFISSIAINTRVHYHNHKFTSFGSTTRSSVATFLTDNVHYIQVSNPGCKVCPARLLLLPTTLYDDY